MDLPPVRRSVQGSGHGNAPGTGRNISCPSWTGITTHSTCVRASAPWRPTVWWNPDAGVAEAERDWLEEKYPGWNDKFGKYWDVITENVRRAGRMEKTYPETLPMVCNCCQLP